ncbi:hypothetical protein ACS7SF_09370 [Ralstonia sp. 25C]|uniref:hypothetical protein n=1 Tax=Ralstonia sp. 25C TaxID=3447363 RepID=UPI003F74B75C
MTDSQAVPDIRRYEAHAELFDKLSKLRAFLSMLYADGFEHFRSLDETRQAEYLWTCLDYAEGAYRALTVQDEIETRSAESALLSE